MDYIPPPAIESPTPEPASAGVPVASDAQAAMALSALRANNPGTEYRGAWASDIPGLVAVQLMDNSIGYTDFTGRFLILGIAFDFDTGKILNFQDGVSTVKNTTDFSGADNE